MPLLETLGAAGISAAGGLAASALGVHESRQNRRFQRDMSNTAYQRTMEDMRKAGLNPILAAKLGGASTPPGSAAQVHDAITPAVQTALQAASAQSQIQLQREQANLVKAQTADTNASAAVKQIEAKRMADLLPGEMGLQKSQIEKAAQEINLSKEQQKRLANMTPIEIQKLNEEIKIAIEEVKRMQSEAESSALGLSQKRAESEFYKSWLGRNKMAIETITDALAPIVGVASAAALARKLLSGGQKKDNFDRVFPYGTR